MNVERLHAIASAIKTDLQTTSTLSHLQNLADALHNLSSSPGNVDYQTALSVNLKALHTALLSSATNTFSPTWKQVISETGMDVLLGMPLAATVDNIIAKNQMTLGVAANEVKVLLSSVTELSNVINALLSGFSTLAVGSEDLDPGECELGVLVPRGFVGNRLDYFAEELEELNKIFGTFSELASNSRPGFEIKTISSSDLSVYLEAAPVVGACIAVAVERIIALYKQLLEVRKLQGELRKQGLEDKSLKGIEDHANGVMEQGIDTLVKELVKEFHHGGEKGRVNELKVELKYSLKKIANRIDRGFNIDVRMSEPATEEGEDTPAERDQTSYERIQGAAAGMQFLKLEGDPILALEEDKPAKTRKTAAVTPPNT